MPNAMIYSRPSDNKAGSVVPTLVTGTVNAAFPLANIYDGNPAKPFKTTSTATQVEILWDFTSAQRLDVFAFIMSNVPFGTNVRFQGNATNAWGGPTVDAAVTIPAYPTDGIQIPAWVDLTVVAGYSATGLRFWRLVVPSIATIVAVGEVWLGTTKRQDIRNYRYGWHEPERHPGVLRRTALGVPLRYGFRVRQRLLDLSIDLNATSLTALREWFRDADGQARASLLVPNPLVNDARMVIFAEDTIDPEMVFTNYYPIDLSFEELMSGPAL